MKNAFARFGKTLGSLAVVGGLMTCGLFAATTALVTVNLPHAVTVGSTTLPSGHYTISAVEMASGDDVLILRSDKGNTTVTLQTQKSSLASNSDKTQVFVTKDGETWNLDKMVIEGSDISYQFAK